MSFSQIILLAVPCIAIGIGLGMAGYRYMLKRDPEKLELWARQAKGAGDKLKDKARG